MDIGPNLTFANPDKVRFANLTLKVRFANLTLSGFANLTFLAHWHPHIHLLANSHIRLLAVELSSTGDPRGGRSALPVTLALPPQRCARARQNQ